MNEEPDAEYVQIEKVVNGRTLQYNFRDVFWGGVSDCGTYR
jgi:hypothetical protein